MTSTITLQRLITGAALIGLGAFGCGKSGQSGGAAGAIIAIDGSSTVFPITEAVAEEFQKVSGARVTIGVSGTGGGFKKFCKGETAVSGASRPIKESEEKLCAESGVEFVELPMAYDGIAVVVHKDNAFVDRLTIAELKTMWAPEGQGKVMKWSQIRAGWPDEELHLFGPGVDSGTYDYFTKAVVGTEHASRGDFTSSEDDNVLVQGVSRDKGALGFFGFAYYAENQDKLKVVPIEHAGKTVVPSLASVGDGTYQPLSRPIFIYVSKQAAERKEVTDFVTYYLTKGADLVKEVGYIPLPAKAYGLAKARFDSKTTGTLFKGGSKVGVTVEQLLSGEGG